LLRHPNGTKLDRWLDDAEECGIPAVVNFAKTLMIDIQVVRNAVIERWSNGQTEGQINRVKTLKRAMFSRANTELLTARLFPLGEIAAGGVTRCGTSTSVDMAGPSTPVRPRQNR
jgi:transposase